ncbi:MAG: hypothetical protein AB7J35_12675 [Dehalococcoidia bacterium]
MYTLIFVSIMVMGWCLLGFIPWLAWSVATRGRAGLSNLPLCLFGAIVAGLAVPLLGKDDAVGIWLSALAAALVATLLLAIRHFAIGSHVPVPVREKQSSELEVKRDID